MATDADQQKKQSQDQKMVLTNIFCAWVLMFCFGVIAVYAPFPKPRLPTLLDRVVFTVRWLIVSLLSVYAGVIWVGNMRYATTAINPLDPSGKKYVEMRSKYLQNTVEQFLLHSFSLIALSTYLSEENMNFVPLLVFLFSIGRLLFAVGYSMHPLKRGVGFATTCFPTVGVIAYCLYCLVVYGLEVYH
ncbi:transmembrane protein 79-like [Oculina patagonica]